MAYLVGSERKRNIAVRGAERARERESEIRSGADRGTSGVNENHDGGGRRVGGRRNRAGGGDC